MMSVEKVIPGIACSELAPRPRGTARGYIAAASGAAPRSSRSAPAGGRARRRLGVSAMASMTRGGEVGGIRAGEAHRRMPSHGADRAEQVGEVVLAVVVAVDRLPEQRDLGGAALRQDGDLGDDVCQPSAPLGASSVRDDAEGAAIVAAALYRDECRRSAFAHGRHILVVLPGPELGIGGALSAGASDDDLGQTPVGVGARPESTRGTRSSSVGPSRWAMHPTTPSTSPGRLWRWSSPIRPITRCSALSRTAQVLTSMTSAAAGSSVAHVPLAIRAARRAAPSPPRSSGSRTFRCRRAWDMRREVTVDADDTGKYTFVGRVSASGPDRHAERHQERPFLRVRPPSATPARREIEPRPAAGRSGVPIPRRRRTRSAAPRGRAETEWCVPYRTAEANGPPERSRGIRRSSPPNAHCTVFFGAGAALRQEIAVATRPGAVDPWLATSSFGTGRHRTPNPKV